ncbi:MAG: protease inhibitor I42 family protein [Chloroflexi bacterium]|nr:protease inhibitor I42 family protein [Chloroflexota bacterium]
MIRFLTLVVMVVLTMSLVVGCVGEIKTYTDSGRTIDIGVNQEFIIALGSNPTTGYMWQASYDETMLELVENTYEPGEYVQQVVVGAGGTELFRFQALQVGQTEITMVYKRPWEEEVLDQKVFTINIKRYLF